MFYDRDISGFIGFWRRLRVIPCGDSVTAELEDDYHCMSVTITHDGVRAIRLESAMHRTPWSTCPGASEQLAVTFDGCDLADFSRCGEKKFNCTHLHDLAVLAAAHVFDAEPSLFDVFIDDPVDDVRHAEIRVNGVQRLSWSESNMTVTGPSEIAGLHLFALGDWIALLDEADAELARLLRWANVIANGRQIPRAQQSDARAMPPNCFSFQPARAAVAKRVGLVRDFSLGGAIPLNG